MCALSRVASQDGEPEGQISYPVLMLSGDSFSWSKWLSILAVHHKKSVFTVTKSDACFPSS